jgi:hypothetical protein
MNLLLTKKLVGNENVLNAFVCKCLRLAHLLAANSNGPIANLVTGDLRTLMTLCVRAHCNPKALHGVHQPVVIAHKGLSIQNQTRGIKILQGLAQGSGMGGLH